MLFSIAIACSAVFAGVLAKSAFNPAKPSSLSAIGERCLFLDCFWNTRIVVLHRFTMRSRITAVAISFRSGDNRSLVERRD